MRWRKMAAVLALITAATSAATFAASGLDARYQDQDGDLVADAPKDP